MTPESEDAPASDETADDETASDETASDETGAEETEADETEADEDEADEDEADGSGSSGTAVRLQKVLAGAGVGSRRACEHLIAGGHVEVDGEVVTHLGTKIDPARAIVRVDGNRVPVAPDRVYLALNKPRGVVSSMSDDRGRPDLQSLLDDRAERLFHVGRLDTDTSGLLLLTNDGDFAHRMAHPSYEVSKTYVALVTGAVKGEVVTRLLTGVKLDDGPARADAVAVLDRFEGRSSVELTLHEGRNRIVRRMFDEVGHPVEQLSRTKIGPVQLGRLKPGETRELSTSELGALLERVGL